MAALTGVAMSMVYVGIVRMFMMQRRMVMPVRMGLARRVARVMGMLMMLVVKMRVLVIHGFVKMLMAVSFCEM